MVGKIVGRCRQHRRLRQASWLVRKSLRSPALEFVIRLAVTAFLLALLARRIDFSAVWKALADADLRFVLPAFLAYLLGDLCLAQQKAIGLRPLNLRLGALDVFRIGLIASFYGLFLPGELVGGLAMWYKLSREGGQPIESAVLLVHFRIVNTVSLMAMGAVGISLDPRFASPGLRAALAAGLASLLLLLVPFSSPRAARLGERLARRWVHELRMPQVVVLKARTIYRSITSFQSLNWRSIAWLWLLSFLSQFLVVVGAQLLAFSVGIRLPLFVISWVRSAVSILLHLPVSLAGLGVRDASLVWLLESYGVPGTQAVALSMLMFAVGVMIGLVGGGLEARDLLSGMNRRANAGGHRD